MHEPTKIKVYRCNNPLCDFGSEGRQWQSFVKDPLVEKEPSDHMRSKCPSCEQPGQKVDASDVVTSEGVEVL